MQKLREELQEVTADRPPPPLQIHTSQAGVDLSPRLVPVLKSGSSIVLSIAVIKSTKNSQLS